MTQTIPAKKNFFNQNVDLMNGPIFKSLFIFMLPIFVSTCSSSCIIPWTP